MENDSRCPGYLWRSQQWAQIIRVHMVNKIDKICIGQPGPPVSQYSLYLQRLTQAQVLTFWNFTLYFITKKRKKVCNVPDVSCTEHNEIQHYKSQARGKPCLQVVKIMFLLRSNVVNYLSKLSLMSQNDPSQSIRSSIGDRWDWELRDVLMVPWYLLDEHFMYGPSSLYHATRTGRQIIRQTTFSNKFSF